MIDLSIVTAIAARDRIASQFDDAASDVPLRRVPRAVAERVGPAARRPAQT
jgi:hypothetical protein